MGSLHVCIHQDMMKKWILPSSFAIILGVISQLVNYHQPLPYMDEVFHVPQSQHFCDHNFSQWDPMITTLPGLSLLCAVIITDNQPLRIVIGWQLSGFRSLMVRALMTEASGFGFYYQRQPVFHFPFGLVLYFTSLLWVEPVHWLLGMNRSSLCIVPLLRAQNILFTLGCYFILHKLLKSLHPRTSSISSFSLACFPLLFFFSFLYYTDNGSTFMMLTGYWLALKDRTILSALVLLVSILFRQTNIIWAGFVSGIVALKILEPNIKNKKQDSSLLTQLISILRILPNSLPSLLLKMWSYILLAVGFLAFLIINGSIVVGDKTHHVTSFHFPQIFYFISFSIGFSAGPLLCQWRLVRKTGIFLFKPRGILIFLLLCIAGSFLVHYFTYEHPYLLADNRHYPFYIWKNIFKPHPFNKYLLVPMYSLCTIFFVTALGDNQSKLWIVLFLSSCLLSLVPQALLEFRYYIIPYLLFRIHISPIPMSGSILEFLHYTIVNIITIWLFIERPFHWEGHNGLQRFMW